MNTYIHTHSQTVENLNQIMEEKSTCIEALESQMLQNTEKFAEIKSELIAKCANLEKDILADTLTVKTLQLRLEVKPLR